MEESECDEDAYEAYIKNHYDLSKIDIESLNETVERKMQLMEI